MKSKPKSSLEQWLADPRAQAFFGEGFAVKLDVLAYLINGGRQMDIAQRHGVSNQAVSKQVCRAKAIFKTPIS